MSEQDTKGPSGREIGWMVLVGLGIFSAAGVLTSIGEIREQGQLQQTNTVVRGEVIDADCGARSAMLEVSYAGVERKFGCPYPHPDLGDPIEVRYDPADPLVADLTSESSDGIPILILSVLGLGLTGAVGVGLWSARSRKAED